MIYLVFIKHRNPNILYVWNWSYCLLRPIIPWYNSFITISSSPFRLIPQFSNWSHFRLRLVSSVLSFKISLQILYFFTFFKLKDRLKSKDGLRIPIISSVSLKRRLENFLWVIRLRFKEGNIKRHMICIHKRIIITITLLKLFITNKNTLIGMPIKQTALMLGYMNINYTSKY